MEEQPQPLEKETAEINGSKTHRLRAVIVFLFLLTVFLVSAYTFIFAEEITSENTTWNRTGKNGIRSALMPFISWYCIN